MDFHGNDSDDDYGNTGWTTDNEDNGAAGAMVTNRKSNSFATLSTIHKQNTGLMY